MNLKLYYPAVFIPYEGGFTVEFPDLPGCVTQGESLEDAFNMAEDAACGWIMTSIEDGEDVPSPSHISEVEVSAGFANYVALDVGEYAKQFSTKAVKKTLTIPEWLNRLAERNGINFSQELQYALKARLGLSFDGFNECVTSLQESAKSLEQLLTTEDYISFNSESGTETMTTASKITQLPLKSNSFKLAN